MANDGKEKWTIMVYLAGDNNLSADMAYALSDIKDIVKKGAGNINLYVYYDSAQISAPTIYCDFTVPDKPVYQLSSNVKKAFKYAGKKRSNDENVLFNENSAAVYSLMNFVDWCVNKTTSVDGEFTHQGKRADKYALILSGHGSAFQNASLMIDSKANYYMTIPKLRWAINQITKGRDDDSLDYHHGVKLLNQKIDILGFDSCTMGLLEIGYEFKDFANTMVASEGNIPSAGWTYGNILASLISKLGNKKKLNSESEIEISRIFVREFIGKQNDFIIGGVNVDLSAWNLKKVNEVVLQVNNLAERLNDTLKPENEFADKLKTALIYSHWKCQSYMLEQTIDLKDFCRILTAEFSYFDAADKTKIKAACDAVVEAVDKCILLCGFSGGKFQYSNGISLFFPWNYATYLTARENYTSLKAMYEKQKPLGEWLIFLDKFLGEISRRNSRISSNMHGMPDTPRIVDPFIPLDKDNHLILGDKDNPNIIGDKDNPNIIGDKDNPRIIGDRDNPNVIGDKGMALLMANFKNVESPWNISGFTKDPNESFIKKRTKNSKKL